MVYAQSDTLFRLQAYVKASLEEQLVRIERNIANVEAYLINGSVDK